MSAFAPANQNTDTPVSELSRADTHQNNVEDASPSELIVSEMEFTREKS